MWIRFFTLAFTICTTIAFAQPADLILHHAKIVTVDAKFNIATSMAIRGERIVVVGDANEVAKFAGPHTRQVDLNGKTVLPGLMDSHVHASEASMYEWDHPVR